MAYQPKYAKPSRGNVAMRLAFVLLCLVILSVYMMAGLLAKYKTSGSGGDEARVAKFEVNVTGSAADTQITCTPLTDTGSYTVTVENLSEVAVAYSIAVDIHPPGDAFPATAIAAALDADSGTLAVGAAAKTHTLTFTVAEWDKITEKMNGQSGQVSFTFTVTVNVEQID